MSVIIFEGLTMAIDRHQSVWLLSRGEKLRLDVFTSRGARSRNPGENWYRGSVLSINIRTMDITTISLDKSTRDGLNSIKDEQGFEHYDATVTWLIEEVDTDN